MKTLIIVVASCFFGSHALAQLDTNLIRDIKSWRKGHAAPARLLKFPDGKIDTLPGCGLQVIGSEVSDYISQIQDAHFLEALMFDYRAQADTFHASVARLISLKGVGHVSRLFAEKRRTDPAAFARSEVAVLSQLLRAPYIDVQVARIAPEDMKANRAQSALQAMRIDLQAGMSWARAYRKHSDRHPDMRDRATNPKSVRTLVCYLYDSVVSPSGFDIKTYRTAESLPVEHLSELFRAKKGTHILKGADGVYLYHIQSYHNDAA